MYPTGRRRSAKSPPAESGWAGRSLFEDHDVTKHSLFARTSSRESRGTLHGCGVRRSVDDRRYRRWRPDWTTATATSSAREMTHPPDSSEHPYLPSLGVRGGAHHILIRAICALCRIGCQALSRWGRVFVLTSWSGAANNGPREVAVFVVSLDTWGPSLCCGPCERRWACSMLGDDRGGFFGGDGRCCRCRRSRRASGGSSPPRRVRRGWRRQRRRAEVVLATLDHLPRSEIRPSCGSDLGARGADQGGAQQR